MPTFIKIPGVTPGTDRPAALSVDPVAPAAGALMLVDPTHPVYRSQFSGVPGNGSTVPNLLWKQAAATIGNGAEATLAAVVDAAGMSGSKGTLERTGKRGIHAIFSQKNNTDPADRTRYGLILPAPIRAYLDANPSHSLYLSIWGYTTRYPSAHSSQAVSLAGIDAGTTSHRLVIDSNRTNLPHPSAPSYAGSREAPAAVGPFYENIAANGSVGEFRIGTSAPTERARLWAVGNTGFLNTYTGGSTPPPQGGSGSHILYRAYLEDLTISGRSYAAVDALDHSYYVQECLTPGGRYFGDTFTAPNI